MKRINELEYREAFIHIPGTIKSNITFKGSWSDALHSAFLYSYLIFAFEYLMFQYRLGAVVPLLRQQYLLFQYLCNSWAATGINRAQFACSPFNLLGENVAISNQFIR